MLSASLTACVPRGCVDSAVTEATEATEAARSTQLTEVSSKAKAKVAAAKEVSKEQREQREKEIPNLQSYMDEKQAQAANNKVMKMRGEAL